MRLLVLGVMGLSLCAGPLPAADVTPAPPHARIAAIYQARCESCHGVRGDGNGPAGHFLTPRPRDFAEAEFKLRSTESGDIPTDEDLERTIRRGIPGTAMPSFRGQLSDEEVAAVITVLKSYSPRFDVDGPGMPLDQPPPAPRDDRAVERGRALFAKHACARCHGDDGRGRGGDARDLTSRALYKGGSAPEEIVRTLTTGMDGSPMTALRRRLPDRELWDLAYYVNSLAAGGDDSGGARPLTFQPRGKAPLTVVAQKLGSGEAGDFFQLVVRDAAGRTIWSGPSRQDPGDPLVFGSWHHGVSLPECAGDIDGDGAVELVAPAPQSDVSPTVFRVLRWTGAAFVPVRRACLLEDPARSGRFPWRTREPAMGRWVSRIRACRDGRLDVELTESRGEDVSTGAVVLEPRGDGFRLVRWTRPMAPVTDAR